MNVNFDCPSPKSVSITHKLILCYGLDFFSEGDLTAEANIKASFGISFPRQIPICDASRQFHDYIRLT